MTHHLYIKSIKKYLTVVIFLLPTFIFSQSEYENHKKYWYYRSRLKNDFIKIGLDSGESIPFNRRGGTKYSDPPFDTTATYMQAGDASARLGIYLSVLATEYRLLKNNNQDVTALKHETFCALNAINRIDFVAEGKCGGVVPNNLNGFFCRDDIPCYLIRKNYRHFNYYNSNTDNSGYPISVSTQSLDRGFTQTYTQGISITESDNCNHPSAQSMDQVFYLLMGLTLTNKLVDTVETDAGHQFP